MNKALIITGITASGKSKVCVELAKKYNGVIINCDSKQIYKEIPIITAQPVELESIPHKLYGYVSAQVNYSVGLWLQDIEKEVKSAWKNLQLPIIIGGSGLYIKSLVSGLSSIPKIDDDIRVMSRNLYEELGKQGFYELVLSKDRMIQGKIHENNFHRLLRAFEVVTQTGKSIFTWHKETTISILDNFVMYVICPPRNCIYNKINKRFTSMVELGVVNEVKQLFDMNLNPWLPAMKAHGVPEIIKYLKNEVTLNEAINTAQINTRHYAKRQYTWFKNQFSNAKFIDDSARLIELDF
ncbi:MAG: tRNA dimethylallyltransferase [Candidatus Mesenet longicola]|uniref:tRNA dimethylallyltransferase n=1 Tax=Candidatus Mesenet longicola TaxID=1892558 RepID=A0A8J3MLN9_9RICK|nr:MAG: tRNA dimethylallyltransferase [Candidatus Mesenet longicola]GHM59134.1 MAG: tRNA dimethylallyltransferase [Candidatus Mesenet longicola]